MMYNTAYFGVTSAQAFASGLPVYEAGGGLYSYGVGANAIIPLSRDLKWAAIVFAGYDHLTGDAGHSPLVQLRGSRIRPTPGCSSAIVCTDSPPRSHGFVLPARTLRV